jgi:hypothetical protein
MQQSSRSHYRWSVLAAGLIGLGAMGAASSAFAAQPYWCTCDGKAKRFLASTRKCEHDHKVKSCSRKQFRAFNKAACASNACTVRY